MSVFAVGCVVLGAALVNYNFTLGLEKISYKIEDNNVRYGTMMTELINYFF